jgi:DNA-directed RNA polymerase specialized sigma24 family protein
VAPSSRRALEEFTKVDVRTLLSKAAVWLTQSEADAEDLVPDAMMSVCDPDEGSRWDPARGKFTANAGRSWLSGLSEPSAHPTPVMMREPTDVATAPAKPAAKRGRRLTRLLPGGTRLPLQ